MRHFIRVIALFVGVVSTGAGGTALPVVWQHCKSPCDVVTLLKSNRFAEYFIFLLFREKVAVIEKTGIVAQSVMYHGMNAR